MKTHLLRTIREVVHADSDPVRQALFDHIRRTNSVVSLVWSTHRILSNTWLSSALVFLFGVKSYAVDASSNEEHLPLIVAVHKNAKKQGRKIESWLKPEPVSWLRVGLGRLPALRTLGRLVGGCVQVRSWSRLLSLVNKLNRRHDFLVSCRATSAIFSYVRALELLKRRKTRGVVVSSDSNPEPLAFKHAAEALGLPTIFLSHAFPTPVSPRLRFTLSILDGQAALERYQSKGPVTGDVLFCGAEGSSQSMDATKLTDEHPVIGIFASKVVCWPQFIGLIEDCRSQFNPKKILIRWHPNMLGRSKLSSQLADASDVVETGATLSLQEVASQCDWVIADENSNANLGVLKAGIPILPMKEFSVLPESRADLYGFVENAVIPKPVSSVRGVCLKQIAQFYSKDWAKRFGRYDASYTESTELLTDQTRSAILKVLSQSQASVKQ